MFLCLFQCPVDLYKEDGLPCTVDSKQVLNGNPTDATCSQGMCLTIDGQCHLLWSEGMGAVAVFAAIIGANCRFGFSLSQGSRTLIFLIFICLVLIYSRCFCTFFWFHLCITLVFFFFEGGFILSFYFVFSHIFIPNQSSLALYAATIGWN